MNEIASYSDLTAYIAKGGTYASAIDAVLQGADAEIAPKQKKSTIATRKAELAKAVKSTDPEVLVPLQQDMQDYVDSLTDIDMTEPRELTAEEAESLMAEFEKGKRIAELATMRREAIKSWVFASIDETNRAKGIESPEYENGRIEVPSLGLAFTKEGAGHKAPALNEKTLRELLGDDASKVFDVTVVPAHEVETLNEEKLAKLIGERAEVMEMIRKSLIPGGQKSAKFQTRPLAK